MYREQKIQVLELSSSSSPYLDVGKGKFDQEQHNEQRAKAEED